MKIKKEKEWQELFLVVFRHLLCMKRMGFLIPPNPLTNFQIQKHYKNEPRFNGVFSRNNLPSKVKDGAYIINLDEYTHVGAHWIALFCNKNSIIYFDSFGVHIPKEI